jgi:hypothetical protein
MLIAPQQAAELEVFDPQQTWVAKPKLSSLEN